MLLLLTNRSALDEDFEVGNKGVDPLMRVVDASLIAARDAALRLDYQSFRRFPHRRGQKAGSNPGAFAFLAASAPMASLAASVRRKRDKINAALTMVTGLRLNVIADRSESFLAKASRSASILAIATASPRIFASQR